MKIRTAAILGAVLAASLCSGLWPVPERASAAAVKVDKVVVIKSKRLMMLLKDGEIFKTYRVALGKQPKGHKIQAGDNRTPEGSYIVDSRNPKSNYYLALRISYPNESDIALAQRLGVSPGGGIMIHGLPNGADNIGKLHGFDDWTNGCIAVTNAEMEEIWQHVPDGAAVEIKP